MEKEREGERKGSGRRKGLCSESCFGKGPVTQFWIYCIRILPESLSADNEPSEWALKGSSVAEYVKWTGDGTEFGFGAEDKGEIGADALDRCADR